MNSASDADDAKHEHKNRLRLYQTVRPDGDHSSIWHWVEHNGPERGCSDRRGTVFSWS